MFVAATPGDNTMATRNQPIRRPPKSISVFHYIYIFPLYQFRPYQSWCSQYLMNQFAIMLDLGRGRFFHLNQGAKSTGALSAPSAHETYALSYSAHQRADEHHPAYEATRVPYFTGFYHNSGKYLTLPPEPVSRQISPIATRAIRRQNVGCY